MKVRITRATSENWYHVGEEYDICENTLHRDGHDYHPLVSDRKIGIGVGHFEIIDEQPKFPFKVRCINEEFSYLVFGNVYTVTGEYAGGDEYILKEGGTWLKSRFEIVEGEDAQQPLEEQNVEVRNKYRREVKPGVFCDVYDILRAWEVTDPCLQHLLKKALQPGKRHHKDLEEDLKDILASAKRAVEMYEEWKE